MTTDAGEGGSARWGAGRWTPTFQTGGSPLRDRSEYDPRHPFAGPRNANRPAEADDEADTEPDDRQRAEADHNQRNAELAQRVAQAVRDATINTRAAAAGKPPQFAIRELAAQAAISFLDHYDAGKAAYLEEIKHYKGIHPDVAGLHPFADTPPVTNQILHRMADDAVSAMRGEAADIVKSRHEHRKDMSPQMKQELAREAREKQLPFREQERRESADAEAKVRQQSIENNLKKEL